MDSLQQIPDDQVPGVNSDVRGFWHVLGPLCWLLNALLNFQIILNSGRNLFTLSKGNATLELDIPAAAAAAVATPTDFSLYDASTTSGGTTTLKVGVRFGIVSGAFYMGGTLPWPTNFTAANGYKWEFPVSTAGVAWLAVNMDTSGAQDRISSIAGDHGTAPPAVANNATVGYLILGAWSVDSSGSTPKLVPLAGFGPNGVGNQQHNFGGSGTYFGPL